MKFPRADEIDSEFGGWTIDPNYLERIKERCDGIAKTTIIEMILLAVEIEDEQKIS
jgi:hypothetical protein